MHSIDKSYLSNSLLEVYNAIGQEMIFTPISTDSVFDKTGKKLRVYNPLDSISFKGVLNYTAFDKDLTKKSGSGIIDGVVTFVSSSLPYPVKKEDSISINGVTFLVVGSNSRVELDVITSVFVTEEVKL